ncbi:hypothetical protein LPB140_11300 [Sphingorhabdus lutea]|uniref:Uncharacterized protein n=1 Tax=Sphingorhabdus lutea TaxID=1913578 RepID=A0A1L3JDR8_9SPHN|nr:hypothetical protein [Sphingorhabdus lutea]APG63272.1 hypothetical protein LPB140_11300 [Sphingorhabdus lutea]
MNQASNSSTAPSRKFKKRHAIYILLAIIAAAIFFAYPGLKAQSQLGASYGAHIACSCRYVSGRDVNSCKGDFEDGMEMVSISDDPENKRVTASVPLLAKSVAQYRKGWGCQQLNETEMDAL